MSIQNHKVAVFVVYTVLFVVCSATEYTQNMSIPQMSQVDSASIKMSENQDEAYFGDDKIEQTLILLKPDAVQRGLIGRVIERFESKGLKLVGLKFVRASEQLVQQHYIQHAHRPFYHYLVKFMISGPIVPMVWEGLNAIKVTRNMIGRPDLAPPGTIRGDLSTDMARSVVHGSHTMESAENEINLWFQRDELVSWTPFGSLLAPCSDSKL
ncbi:nucleoside diphosphate kinase-like [Sitodiplosis mosellana]|uniref:nucleoside diphosphate kinase-like n=1 Tax=Sitodiplosis mosellana TaxID=263140 RepID=UPI002444CB6E|nr:nucleoside diphosphate kinase-like [Sitodiplosis mosellana]